MLQQGVPADQIDAYITAKQKAKPESKDISVMEDNWNAVQVYSRCLWQIQLGTMGGVCYIGIETSEIVSVANALKIEVNEDLLDCIRILQNAAQRVYNAKT
jgi:hypothetical protein